MRVFLDTNVLVSAFTSRGICADILTLVLAEHQLVTGEAVLGELGRVLKEKMRMPQEAISEAEAILRREGAVVSRAADVRMEIRNPDDVVVLGEAVEGATEILVTGDRNLLDVAGAAPIRIVSPRGFWELMRSAGEG